MPQTTTHTAAVKRAIGLMSGTSVDGVDAVLVAIQGQGLTARVRVLAQATYPYPPALREQILAASYPASSSVDLICHLNFALGACFADAALAVAQAAGVAIGQIDFIGSHGQTIHHIPVASASPLRQVSTLQLGEPCVIAERTGVTTVADFRPRDIAAGGLGAPLAPYGHYVLFADPHCPRVVQNIGGIANVTVLADPDFTHTLAFDTGPGNMLIDDALRHFTAGQQQYDVDGQMAAQGTVHQALLTELLQHPFVTQPPPKATGREAFGKTLLHTVLERAHALGLAPADIVRTFTAFTAESIVLNYQRFIFPHWPIAEVVVCGGGVYNPTLMRMLRERLQPCTVTTPEDYGYPNKVLEAILFALLAHATLSGYPGNSPHATGAQHPVVLGKIVPGAGRR
ncbi:MAG TPA: anhydro-N-acetylmuramic acid kinase [Candidatus Tectomicrobia bacterium]